METHPPTVTPLITQGQPDENGDPVLDLHFHPGQLAAWNSTKRVILLLAGSRAGKTSFAALWLYREIAEKGPGDYLVAAPDYKLIDKAAGPEVKKVFSQIHDLGKTREHPWEFRMSSAGERLLWGKTQDVPTRIVFGHADDPDSLAAMTAKAAWLDEAGQKKFKAGSWEEVYTRRLSIDKGRVLISTTPYCYDEQTEIYTRAGWKLFGELTPDDEVMACTPAQQGHFEKPSDIIWQRYVGPMIEMKGGRIDLLVTPDHRISYRNAGRTYEATAEEFVRKQYRSLPIPKTVTVAGEEDWFTLPAIDVGHRWGTIHRPAVRIRMEDWCAFFGWFLSEGSTKGSKGGKIERGGYLVNISQIPGDKRERIRFDLARLPFKWSETPKGFQTSDKQLWDYLRTFGHSKTKYIPAEIRRAGSKNLRVFIDRMVLGDGNYRHDRHGEFQYYTSSKRLAEDFAEVCMLAGISTKIKRHVQAPSLIRGRTTLGGEAIYHVSQRKRQAGLVKSHCTVPYDGFIGCVTVSTGFVLVRRNGEECICGNCWNWLKTEIHDKWKAAGKDHPEIDVFQFPSTANPAFDAEEDAKAKRDLPRWRYEMMFRGLFTKPAGTIYDIFDEPPHKHKVPRFDIPEDWPRYVGLDFGGVNTAAVYLAEDPASGKLYAYREYHTGRRSAAEHIWYLRQGEPDFSKVAGGSKSEGQWRMEFQAGGVTTHGKVEGMNVVVPDIRAGAGSEVEVGINRVYGTFQRDELFVFDDLTELCDELSTYSRVLDDRLEPTEVIDEKETYHLLDALRYIVGHLKRGGQRVRFHVMDPNAAREQIVAAQQAKPPEEKIVEHTPEEVEAEIRKEMEKQKRDYWKKLAGEEEPGGFVDGWKDFR